MESLTVRSLARLSVVSFVSFACLLLPFAGCGRFGAVYPPRPAAVPGPPAADPAPSRIVVHVSVTHEGLEKALDAAVPRTGEGEVALLGGSRHYAWTRQSVQVRFQQGRLVLSVHVDARVSLPLHTVELPFELEVLAEPVMNRDYAVKLQSVEVKVSSGDRRLEVANAVGGVFDSLARQVRTELEHFAYDVKPLLGEAYSRVARPAKFPVGEATGCARV